MAHVYIQAGGHLLTEWCGNAYETLYKRHMNINEMASRLSGWHRPLW